MLANVKSFKIFFKKKFLYIFLFLLFSFENLAIANEKENIIEFIKTEFPDKNATSLFNSLKVKSDNSISFNENINELNKKLSKSEKLDLLRTIWNLILADGVVDKYEENLFYRIGDLIHIKRTELNKIKNT